MPNFHRHSPPFAQVTIDVKFFTGSNIAGVGEHDRHDGSTAGINNFPRQELSPRRGGGGGP